MTSPAVNDALPKLLALATVERGQAWSDRLSVALAAAAVAGWAWPKRALFACHLIYTQDSDPEELKAKARGGGPVQLSGPAVPPAASALYAEKRGLTPAKEAS